jgi:hypothetical protein
MSKLIDLTGKTFGRLTVISLHSISPRPRWNCVCTCGGTSISLSTHLKDGSSTSCGCYLRELRTTHGESLPSKRTKEHKLWLKMKDRCKYKTLKIYKYYGGRGIKVCDRWLNSYENFLADIGRAPTPKHTLDRIDVNGDYEPNNCRWATYKEQENNRTNNKIYEYEGQSKTLSQWADVFGVNRKMLQDRIWRGWTIERALTTPIHIENRAKLSYQYLPP